MNNTNATKLLEVVGVLWLCRFGLCVCFTAWLFSFSARIPAQTQSQSQNQTQESKSIHCVVNPEVEVDFQIWRTHLAGRIYFSDQASAERFAKNHLAFATAANRQLFLTRQYAQVACPFSGGQFLDQHSVTFGDREFKFCCPNCVNQFQSTTTSEQKKELLFGRKNFSLGFKIQNQFRTNLKDVRCVVSGQPALEQFQQAHLAGRVYFADQSALEKYQTEPADYLLQANWQLLRSNQYRQRACPFSGADVVADHDISFKDQTIGLCCENCRLKVTQATEDQQLEMLFNKRSFGLGFVKNVNKKTASDP